MTMQPVPATSVPMANQLFGTSIAARGSSASAFLPPKIPPSPASARPMLRHWKANEVRPAVTIIAEPAHRPHARMFDWLTSAFLIAPRACISASTPEVSSHGPITP